jgi:phosphoserine phosphatase
LSGDILSDNCKGEAKMRMLRAQLGRDETLPASFAFGDSKRDLPALRWVDKGFVLSLRGVFRSIGCPY